MRWHGSAKRGTCHDDGRRPRRPRARRSGSYLLLGRGGFWLARERDDRQSVAPPAGWPCVVAVVPARNEADVIAQSVESLLRQDYPGPFRIVLVDDHSDDGTGEIARRSAERLQCRRPPGDPARGGLAGRLDRQALGPAPGRRGKAGEARSISCSPTPTSATARTTCATWWRAPNATGCVLVSLMAELHVRPRPSASSSRPSSSSSRCSIRSPGWHAATRAVAAAAGGCMLVRRAALEDAGGIASIRSEIIDDCALARRLKDAGADLARPHRRVRSLGPMAGLPTSATMVSRSAYAQLAIRRCCWPALLPA